MDRLDIPSAHLVALSRGGRVALEFALHYAARTRSLVLIDTALRFRDDSFPPNDSVRDIRLRVDELVQQCRIDDAREHWLTAPIWQSPQGSIDPLVRQIVTDYFAAHDWGTTSRNTDLEESDLLRIEAPALVMVGDHDLPEFKGSGKLLLWSLARCELLSVPDAGHLANIDNPGMVNDAIASFIARQTRQS